jgi:hypothetical protein
MVMFLNKKAIALIVLLGILSVTVAVANAVSVGVKKGDWIEYNVTSSNVPADHDITHSRMEVMDVQGDVIQVNILSTYSNGTQVSTNSTLNLDTGSLIDNFIIPANLTTGTEFNSNMGNMGRMMIGGSRQGTYCGTTRDVVTATLNGNTYVWDRATGVSVEGTSEGTLDGQAYTMHSLATGTNMWQTGSAATPDNTLLSVAIIAVVAIVVVALVVVLAMRRGKK